MQFCRFYAALGVNISTSLPACLPHSELFRLHQSRQDCQDETLFSPRSQNLVIEIFIIPFITCLL